MRFKEYQGDWKVVTIGECSSSLEYGMNSAAIKFDGENKYIRITDIDDESRKYKSNSPVSPEGVLLDKYLVKENDILFVRTGADTGRSYLYRSFDGKLYFAGFLIRARIKESYNGNFIFAQTLTQNYNKWVKLMSMRSGQPGINSKEYSCFQFKIPTKEEQDKISSFLTKIDTRIETQSKIIEDLKVLSRSVAQQIFAKNLIFQSSYKTEWSTKQISEILTIGSGKDYKHLNTGDIPVFGTGGHLTFVDQFLHDGETVCIGRKGTIDKPMYYNGKIWTVDTLFYTHSFRGVLPKFIFYTFRLINWKEYNEASGVPSLSKSTIEKIEIDIPPMNIQHKIVAMLSLIDVKVNNEGAILSNLQKQKSQLLKSLFI